MKNIIITGAAGGVGIEIAKLLQKENLILIDTDEDKLKEIALKLHAQTYIADVSNERQVIEICDDIKLKYNKIDCLIQCAGLWISGELSKSDSNKIEMEQIQRIKEVVDTNLFGTIAMIQCVYPIMKQQGYGQIININSQSGVVCEPNFPIYNATKTGASAFRKAIQDDLAHYNIKVTDICPGLIQTDFYKNANDPHPKSVMELGLSPLEVAQTVQYLIELPSHITIPSIELKNIKNY